MARSVRLLSELKREPAGLKAPHSTGSGAPRMTGTSKIRTRRRFIHRSLECMCIFGRIAVVRQWPGDFPVMTERIQYSSKTPSVVFIDRYDLCCARRDGRATHVVRIGNYQQHPYGTSTKGNRAIVLVFRRLVSNPKNCTGNRKLRNDRAGLIVDAVQDFGTKCGFVETNRVAPIVALKGLQ